jgi:hypothetical protein
MLKIDFSWNPKDSKLLFLILLDKIFLNSKFNEKNIWQREENIKNKQRILLKIVLSL